MKNTENQLIKTNLSKLTKKDFQNGWANIGHFECKITPFSQKSEIESQNEHSQTAQSVVKVLFVDSEILGNCKKANWLTFDFTPQLFQQFQNDSESHKLQNTVKFLLKNGDDETKYETFKNLPLSLFKTQNKKFLLECAKLVKNASNYAKLLETIGIKLDQAKELAAKQISKGKNN